LIFRFIALSHLNNLLSIAIPAYNRPQPLLKALQTFVTQIAGHFEKEVEIVVSDDGTPEDRLSVVRDFAQQYPELITWRSTPYNIGLERNLLACTEMCRGEYLWIFGDDDFLEADDALAQILTVLRDDQYDMLVMNRTRRSTDLSQLLTSNWMGLDPALRQSFDGLRAFCLAFGYLSVVGFVSVNVFRRRPFQQVNASRYLGTMYPQLGAMVEAFHDRPLLLIGKPLICHRTQTAEEKRAALGAKVGEAEFMADTKRRNAIYFSHPHIGMLDQLLRCQAFYAQDILAIRENTVIKGYLVDFLINCVQANQALPMDAPGAGTPRQWQETASFFARLPLDRARRGRVDAIFSHHQPNNLTLSVSAITTSFNQAVFLDDCLRSVRDQSYPPVEHLIYDPGSTDGSRDIATRYPHATLISEPDEGQSDALNKGFSRACGDIICWLNSDDQLADQDVLYRVVDRFQWIDAPDIVYGRGIYIDEDGQKLRDAYINQNPFSLSWRLAQEVGIMQPALFMRRSVIERVGWLRNDLHFSMDYEYWIRCVKIGIRFAYLNDDLAIARYHIGNKTYGQRGDSYAEVCQVMQQHFGYVSHHWLKRWAEFLTDGHDGVLRHGKNAGVCDPVILDETYRALLMEYNGETGVLDILKQRMRNHQGARATFLEMQQYGLVRS
jgi:glycosyltransferase involved in cell wall biosynthesis